jgi:hypothetical protein
MANQRQVLIHLLVFSHHLTYVLQSTTLPLLVTVNLIQQLPLSILLLLDQLLFFRYQQLNPLQLLLHVIPTHLRAGQTILHDCNMFLE